MILRSDSAGTGEGANSLAKLIVIGEIAVIARRQRGCRAGQMPARPFVIRIQEGDMADLWWQRTERTVARGTGPGIYLRQNGHGKARVGCKLGKLKIGGNRGLVVNYEHSHGVYIPLSEDRPQRLLQDTGLPLKVGDDYSKHRRTPDFTEITTPTATQLLHCLATSRNTPICAYVLLGVNDVVAGAAWTSDNDLREHTTVMLRNFISVVVATCNRASALRSCLDSLRSLRIPEGVAFEVICVDNNSTDETRHVVEESTRHSKIPVRYVLEPHPGASWARNAGLREARGEIIAITDDDCIVDANWLVSIWTEFVADMSLGILGGRVELHDKRDLPMTIRTSRERSLFELGALTTHAISANLAIRQSVIGKIGLFDQQFGPGSSLFAGEDLDFVFRAHKAGIKIIYSPDVLVFHNHGRRTEADRAELRRRYAIGTGAFYFKHILGGDRDAMRLAYWEAGGLLTRGLSFRKTANTPNDNMRQLGYFMLGAVSYFRIRTRSCNVNSNRRAA